MKKSRILAGIWMLFLVLAYLVSASITIGIAAVATVLLCFFCFFLSIEFKRINLLVQDYPYFFIYPYIFVFTYSRFESDFCYKMPAY